MGGSTGTGSLAAGAAVVVGLVVSVGAAAAGEPLAAGAASAAALVAFAVFLALLRAARPAPSPGDPDRRRWAEIASMIAHELRNPLMSIKGLATTGARMYGQMSDRERREFFQLIDDEAARLRLVAEEAATALRIDAGLISYHPRPEPLGSLIEEAVWQVPLRGHPVSIRTDPDLTVPVDRARFAEVLTHLVDNAAKFSPSEEPIEVRAYRTEGGDAVVEVLDRGPGIPPEIRGRVFDRFAQHRAPGYEEVPGAGLGLFICRAHVEAHGGTIVAEPGPGRGTMLRVTLPG
ncbi:MAG TPA: HAMP domain-containing sensor histidine kinase [Actinomycetota bacterium]|nr:HAMP domain-containing sensor histidine kinase [Actinomycetota bacterium]